MLDRSDALSLGRFGSASAPKLGVFPLDGMLGSVNKSLSTGTRTPKRVMGRQFTFRYICLCYSGRKRYNPSPGSSRYSHKGSIGPGGTCFLGAGAGYPLRALLGQDEKTPQHSWAPPLRLAGRRNPRSWDGPTTHMRVDYWSVVRVVDVYPLFVHT